MKNQKRDHAADGNEPRNADGLSGIARAAIWLGGSALFGSLALVLWNRRALRSMHEAPEVPDAPLPLDNDIY
jgi:hypothetical protein